MIRRHPGSSRSDTLFPYMTLVRCRAEPLGPGHPDRRTLRRDLRPPGHGGLHLHAEAAPPGRRQDPRPLDRPLQPGYPAAAGRQGPVRRPRSEEHTSELQSLMRISYAVFCLKKKKELITLTNQTLTRFISHSTSPSHMT